MSNDTKRKPVVHRNLADGTITFEDARIQECSERIAAAIQGFTNAEACIAFGGLIFTIAREGVPQPDGTLRVTGDDTKQENMN